jgi:sulfite reductase alpha subunit-like flavoprotein
VITLLYATVSGNAEQLALVARDRLRNAGGEVEVYNVADFPATRLREIDTALIFTSSWGEGAPPPDAVEFCHALEHPQLKLEHLAFAVFEHGARSNGNSCGRRIDAALHARGATRLMPALECGLRTTAPFEAWFAEVQREMAAVTV